MEGDCNCQSVNRFISCYQWFSNFIYYSYVEENIRRSSQYRRYNRALPEWLHNKPKSFTKHCVEKIALSQEIEAEHITMVENKDGDDCVRFNIQSVRNGDQKYLVSFSGKNACKCECFDWKKTLLPCKHIVAVVVTLF